MGAPRPNASRAALKLACVLLGTIVVAGIAAGMCAWLLAGHGRLGLFFAMTAQGLIVGITAAVLLRWGRLRSITAGIMVGTACGLASAWLFQYGSYLRTAYLVRERLRQEWAQAGIPDTRENRDMLDRVLARPVAIYDQTVLFPQTGRHGFVAYMLLPHSRAWAMALIQAAMIAWIAANFGRYNPQNQTTATSTNH